MSMSENPSFEQSRENDSQPSAVNSAVDKALDKINIAFLNLNEKIESIFSRISNKVAQPSLTQSETEFPPSNT